MTTGPGRGEPAPIRMAVKLIMAQGQIKLFQAKSGTGTPPPEFDRHCCCAIGGSIRLRRQASPQIPWTLQRRVFPKTGQDVYVIGRLGQVKPGRKETAQTSPLRSGLQVEHILFPTLRALQHALVPPVAGNVNPRSTGIASPVDSESLDRLLRLVHFAPLLCHFNNTMIISKMVNHFSAPCSRHTIFSRPTDPLPCHTTSPDVRDSHAHISHSETEGEHFFPHGQATVPPCGQAALDGRWKSRGTNPAGLTTRRFALSADYGPSLPE
ncbi:hypothetical protein Sfum_1139 [Syntrophobacter fumaroxidans MPOB]|uniref:Uncharacterized protein n=1 Tax=Syntrophobacter fumaroxidans (strain DSM 10017 / MPOB) TaxID=335543 RepID=A0LHD0_SYNFM|nr:hypothetical protein Sfum_1139 [Syntrophobacter fumaroxidans MPOB]